jgi:hypothetical protein
MTDTSPTKSDLHDAIEAERRYWNTLVEAMKHAGLLNESSEGEDSWTFRDVAVHLNGWRGWTLTRLTAALHGENLATHPWPEGLSEETQADVDAINAWFAAQATDQTTTDVLAETGTQFDALAAAVTAMPDDDLLTPGRFPWLGNYPIGPALLGYSFGHLHSEHEPKLRAWLRDATGVEPALPPAPPNFGYEE